MAVFLAAFSPCIRLGLVWLDLATLACAFDQLEALNGGAGHLHCISQSSAAHPFFQVTSSIWKAKLVIRIRLLSKICCTPLFPGDLFNLEGKDYTFLVNHQMDIPLNVTVQTLPTANGTFFDVSSACCLMLLQRHSRMCSILAFFLLQPLSFLLLKLWPWQIAISLAPYNICASNC